MLSKPADEHAALAPGGLQRSDGAKGHAVVAAQDGLHAGVLGHQRRHDLAGARRFPVRGLRSDDRQSGLARRVLKSARALDAVEGVGRAFEDGDRIARLQPCGDGAADGQGAGTVVGADKRHGELALGHRVAVQPIVDVDDDDARHRPRAGSRSTSAFESAGASTIACTRRAIICSTRRDLTRDVLLVLDPGGDQFVRRGVRRPDAVARRLPWS